MKKFTSRKFWAAIVVVLCAIVLMCAGAISPELGIKIILGAAGGWVGVEGVLDAIGMVKKKDQ